MQLILMFIGLAGAGLAVVWGLGALWAAMLLALVGAGLYLASGVRLAGRMLGLLLQGGAVLLYLRTLDFGDENLFLGSVPGAVVLGGGLLCTFCRLQDDARVRAWERWALLPLGWMGLGCWYLVAPLSFDYLGTTVMWAWGGWGTVVWGVYRRRARSPARSSATPVAPTGLRRLPYSRMECGVSLDPVGAQLAGEEAGRAGPPLPGTPAVLLCALAIELCAGALLLLFGQGMWGDLIDDGSGPLGHGDFWAALSLALSATLAARALWRASADARWARYAFMAWAAVWWWFALSSEMLRLAPRLGAHG